MFDELYNLFRNESGVKTKFNVILIILIILMIMNFYFGYNSSSIIILVVFALAIANYYTRYENENVDDFNITTMAKLAAIQSEIDSFIEYKMEFLRKTGAKDTDYRRLFKNRKVSSLYMDANLIHFLHSVLKLSDWNKELYYKLTMRTNGILAILEEIEHFNEANEESGKTSYQENIAEMLELAMELRLRAINDMHDFVYTMPKSNKTNIYLGQITERYRTLITRVTDKIYSHYKRALEQRGINNMTKFVNYFESPKALDPNDFGKFY